MKGELRPDLQFHHLWEDEVCCQRFIAFLITATLLRCLQSCLQSSSIEMLHQSSLTMLQMKKYAGLWFPSPCGNRRYHSEWFIDGEESVFFSNAEVKLLFLPKAVSVSKYWLQRIADASWLFVFSYVWNCFILWNVLCIIFWVSCVHRLMQCVNEELIDFKLRLV